MLTKKESLKNEVKTSKSPKINQEQATEEKQQPKGYAPIKHQETSEQQASYPYSDKKPAQKTKITVKYNTGYGNQLYIRGKGANLNWDKGTPLKNVKADEWTWETEHPFGHCEFKVLINDRNYENGENHYVNQGANIVYTPHFYH